MDQHYLCTTFAHTHILWKRALHTRKRAPYIHKRALYIHNRALHIHKRALNLIHQPISAGPALGSRANTKTFCGLKRALHTRKRALYIYKRVLYLIHEHISAGPALPSRAHTCIQPKIDPITVSQCLKPRHWYHLENTFSNSTPAHRYIGLFCGHWPCTSTKKSPIYPQKSPIYAQKSPASPLKSRIYPQKIPVSPSRSLYFAETVHTSRGARV